MAFALDNTIEYWNLRFRSGPAGKFLLWWAGELKQILPVSWQQRLQRATRRVTFVAGADSLTVGVDENHLVRVLETVAIEADATLQGRQIRGLLERNDLLEVPRFLLLDASRVLRKKLVLPRAAEANLRQVLSFEMDRQTPFRAAEVYYDWKMLESEHDGGHVHLELFVTPRRAVEASAEMLNARGLALSGIDVLDQGEPLGLNLLPLENRLRVVNPKTRLNYGLAAVALVLLVVVMAQSLNLRVERVELLEEAIAEVQDEARLVQRLRQQVMETSEAASFLTVRRSNSPMAIELLAGITRMLPDDTYLDRLLISEDSVLLQGKSRNAQQLIEVVNKSPMFRNAAFRGSTRLDSATGLEVFEVNADIVAASATSGSTSGSTTGSAAGSTAGAATRTVGATRAAGTRVRGAAGGGT